MWSLGNKVFAKSPAWFEGAEVFGLRTERHHTRPTQMSEQWWLEQHVQPEWLRKLIDTKLNVRENGSKPLLWLLSSGCHDVSKSVDIQDYLGAIAHMFQAAGYPRPPHANEPWRASVLQSVAQLAARRADWPTLSTSLQNRTTLFWGLVSAMQPHLVRESAALRENRIVLPIMNGMTQSRLTLHTHLSRMVAFVAGVPTVDFESSTIDADSAFVPGDVRHHDPSFASVSLSIFLRAVLDHARMRAEDSPRGGSGDGEW